MIGLINLLVDEYHGVGGSYILDPETGVRKLIEQTQPANNQPEDLSDGSADAQTTNTCKV